jgi:outer membrane protein OmpU
MKKLLLGTTALVAAGLVAGEASAASALKLGITGFYRNAIGGSFGNGPTTQLPTVGGGVSTAGLGNFDRQAVSMRQEIRVNFTGEATLDNGITVGVLVGLDGENVAKSGSTEQFDRAYAEFKGKFGLIRIGEADSALETDCVVDPGNVTSNFGVNSPNESFSDVGFAQIRNKTLGTANVSNTPAGYFSTFGVAPIGSIGTCFGIENKGDKIMYFSPDFGGFNFGISYTPTGGQRRAGGGLSYGTDVTAPGPFNAGNNILSVGADYYHESQAAPSARSRCRSRSAP